MESRHGTPADRRGSKVSESANGSVEKLLKHSRFEAQEGSWRLKVTLELLADAPKHKGRGHAVAVGGEGGVRLQPGLSCRALADALHRYHHIPLSRSSTDSPQRAAPSRAGARATLPWKRSHGIARHLDVIFFFWERAGIAQTLHGTRDTVHDNSLL